MKKVIYGYNKGKKKLAKLPRLYIVGLWAHYGVMDRPLSNKTDERGIPLVWDYVDCNGYQDKWILVPVDYITTGWICAWTVSKDRAESLAEAMNARDNSWFACHRGFDGYIEYHKEPNKLACSIGYENRTICCFDIDDTFNYDVIRKEFKDRVDKLINDKNVTMKKTLFGDIPERGQKIK